MQLDVALCMSGQMRTYKKCYGSLKLYVLDELDPDVFIHTWKDPGITTKFGGNEDSKSVEKVRQTTLKRLYDPTTAVIEEFQEEYYTQKGEIRVPPELVRSGHNRKGDIPMFYKMKQCNNLKRDEEKRLGKKYDLVIRMRPDLEFHRPVPDRVLESPSTLWHTNPGDIRVSDKFAVSSSEHIDYHTAVWDRLSEYWQHPFGESADASDGPDDYADIRVGERLMRHHMAQSDIDVREYDRNFNILRSTEFFLRQPPDPESSDLTTQLVKAMIVLDTEGAKPFATKSLKHVVRMVRRRFSGLNYR